jgi:cytidyltransferase-like protein
MHSITVGTFDLFHFGHVRLLKSCLKMSDTLDVGLNTDEFIFKYKGKMPVLSYKHRKESILETGLVENVYPNDQEDGTIKKCLERSKARLLIIGSDWGRKDYLSQIGLDWEYLDCNLISLAYVPYTWAISTTKIKQAVYDQSDNPNP